jgi:Topoisomerase VI B subunit, transducer
VGYTAAQITLPLDPQLPSIIIFLTNILRYNMMQYDTMQHDAVGEYNMRLGVLKELRPRLVATFSEKPGSCEGEAMVPPLFDNASETTPSLESPFFLSCTSHLRSLLLLLNHPSSFLPPPPSLALPTTTPGHPFLVEAAVSIGGTQVREGINVYRFANRIPLLFETGQ